MDSLSLMGNIVTRVIGIDMGIRATSLLLIGLSFVTTGCFKSGEPGKPQTEQRQVDFVWPQPSDPGNATEALIFATNLSEEMILDLSPGFKLLVDRFKGNQVELTSLLENAIDYSGPAQLDLNASLSAEPESSNGVVHLDWPLMTTVRDATAGDVWLPVLDQVKFEDAQFGVRSGEIDQASNVFRMKTVFEGRGRDANDRLLGIKATQTVDWVPVGEDQWKIEAWHQDSLEVTFSPTPIFADVTNRVIEDVDLREWLRRSGHENTIRERFTDTSTSKIPLADPDHPHFSDWESSFQYPAASVVDVDGDGWDDLFVMDRTGKSRLLRNNQGKSFSDITDASGLQVDGFANAALFADFDNDGDPDALVCRTLEPSLYFRNDGGTFVRDSAICDQLIDAKFVVAGSVADINRDGLLDVYLDTYCFTGANPVEWVPEVVREEDVLKFKVMIDRNNPFLDRGGPPNIVLMNRGGKLERVKIDNTLKQWRSSYQSVWHDIDQDGDADLYVCNDFSPDVFLRNDTPQGSFEPEFTDITSEVIPGGSMAFGMGANLGDYNSDGQLDLYVSNMYSKAGLRIVNQLGGEVDPRIKASAKGNFLYENQGGKLSQVAGLDASAQHVSKVGWSFGGQLADFNNDSKLDLYVPSGFFSAPKLLASTVDL